MPSPFYMFSWDKPFLPALVTLVDTLTDKAPERAVIVVPHNRPRRYLTELYRLRAVHGGAAQLLPRVLTVQEFIALLRAQSPVQAVHTANLLDRVAVLYDCVQALAADDAQLCARFAGMDIPRFLPWGLRLGALFEECFTQNIETPDVPYAEGEVSAVAAVLLNAVGRLQRAYVQALVARQWTTAGLDAFTVAHTLAAQWKQGGGDASSVLPPLLCPREEERVVLLAGFGVLSGTEDAILRCIWQAGAHVCLHTDIAVLDNKGHWACSDHQQWLTRWGAQGVVVNPDVPADLSAESVAQLGAQAHNSGPRIHFVAGYDAHSQLLAVRDMLDKDEANAPSTAIVLADSALLMPALHSLPDKGVNISMGYPLERTPLCRLVDSVLHAHATRQEDGRYHWRTLRHCLRHPYLQMLSSAGDSSDEGGVSLRPVLLRMESLLRKGSRFVDADDTARKALEGLGSGENSPLACLTRKVLTCVLHTFAAVRTPEDTGRAVAGLCALLVEHGEQLWERYPLDAESMYRLMHDVVPTLQGSALAQTVFPLPTLHSLVRQAIQAGRVPFEADPIAGMQVLGMLETRLLHFDRVVIVDATDDNLPGSPAQDPLLPDSLRLLVGLPDARHRDRTTAHNLYRLLQSAKDVYFYWQEGVQRSALFDGKKSRSRFVDALIWQEEQRRGTVLQPGEDPLQVTPCPVRPMNRVRTPLRNSPALRARMAEILAKGLSPTRLDAYMTCPLRFAFKHVCGINSAQEVNEGDDPVAVGTLVHEALHYAYTPYVHADVHSGDLTVDMLVQTFQERLEASDLRTKLPPDSYFMLALAGPLRLGRYLERQPATTHIVALEHTLAASLSVGDSVYIVHGQVDRVDKRHNALVVLDYKTGKVATPVPTLWSDEDFWQSLRCYFAGLKGSLAGTQDAVPDPILTLAKHISSVQLPCYVYLLSHNDVLRAHGPVGDAALVRLHDDGKEIVLFGDALDSATKHKVIEEHIPTLLGFILQHMEFTDEFVPIEGEHCTWCEYDGMCLK